MICEQEIVRGVPTIHEILHSNAISKLCPFFGNGGHSWEGRLWCLYQIVIASQRPCVTMLKYSRYTLLQQYYSVDWVVH